MEFIPAELIRKKRFGGEHTAEELHFLIKEYVENRIPDYQIAAWLMAVCFKGMSPDETARFTLAMRDSGAVLDLTRHGVTVDKHSTGGVGDKTSLLLAPLAAAAGLTVPMMAGRGLAHSGGTLDKLESIPGFRIGLSLAEFQDQLARVGAAIIGQTKEMCPADRKLYALRDVTGTVDSLPLICGSIMSKKLAEGMSALVLDVKFGSGAFMKSADDAENLAQALIHIGESAGKKVTALVTRMDEPLGRYIGNSLEVRESLDIMAGKTSNGKEGKSYSDTIELTLQLASHMFVLGGKAPTAAEGYELAKELLADGSALAKFYEITAAQGGRLGEGLPIAKNVTTVRAEQDGFMNYTDVEKLGVAALVLGAGRKRQTDTIEFSAGIEIYRAQGESVRKGTPLFDLHYADAFKSSLQEAVTILESGFQVSTEPAEASALIKKVFLCPSLHPPRLSTAS